MVYELEVLKLFVLVMVRFSGLMISAPVLGSANFPMVAKIGLSGLAAVLVTPMVLPATPLPLPDDFLSFALLGAGELLIGLAIGFVMTIAFAAIQVAGQVIDMLSGFALVNVFNPALETQVPVFGFFLFVIAVLYLLAMNGHHLMIRALVSTFDKIPVGGFVMRPALLAEVNRWGSAMFIDGLMIAAPVAAALLMAYVTMGLLGRMVPQIHLFVVGFPLTIALSLLMVALFLDIYLHYLDGVFGQMFRNVNTLIRGMT